MGVQRIQITSKKEGFCRCGVAHSVTPTVHEDGKFTKEQLKKLKNEPMLVVTELPDNPPKDDDGGGSGKDKEKKPKKPEGDPEKDKGDK